MNKINTMTKSILLATMVCTLSTVATAEEVMNTRFGVVSVSDETGEPVLWVNGEKWRKPPQHSLLVLERQWTWGDKDVVLIQGVDGNACPAQYYFLAIGQNFAKLSPAFGTCSDVIEVKQNAEYISVTMPKFGEMTTPNKRQARTIYRYNIHALTENGKAIY